MIRQIVEFTNIIYAIIMILSGYGFGLFAWWWRVMGKASEIYIYITLLFLGIFVSAGAGIYSRIIHCVDNDYYHEFIFSYWWALGPCVVLAVLLAINIRMTRRVLRWRKGLIKRKCPHCGQNHNERKKKGVQNG
jgi:hypothetical protein